MTQDEDSEPVPILDYRDRAARQPRRRGWRRTPPEVVRERALMAVLGFGYAILALSVGFMWGIQEKSWMYSHFVLGQTLLVGVPAVLSLPFRRWRLIGAGVLIPYGLFLLLNSITCFPM